MYRPKNKTQQSDKWTKLSPWDVLGGVTIISYICDVVVIILLGRDLYGDGEKNKEFLFLFKNKI
jgi:hypothetical protein